jgi:formylglycine-generating enzyme required for sulfatase activity
MNHTSHEPVMVSIPGQNYELGKYDVTLEEFEQFVNESRYSTTQGCHIWTSFSLDLQSDRTWRDTGFKQEQRFPVTCVNYDDIQAYLSWLNQKTGKEYRLPTSAEWEYACLGAKRTEFCGSNDVDTVAWSDANSGNTVHPVGQLKANDFGLYDMSGNVWQWTDDCWEGDCKRRVLRGGGSWGQLPQFMGAMKRIRYETAYRSNLIGFRLARTRLPIPAESK